MRLVGKRQKNLEAYTKQWLKSGCIYIMINDDKQNFDYLMMIPVSY